MPILDKQDENQVKRYKKFLDNNEYVRLNQALEWSKVKEEWKSEVVYIEEEGKIVAGMLILLQKVPYFNSYLMYVPRGPVCNIYDIKTVKSLISEAEGLLKKYKVFCIKIDPSVKNDPELEKLYKDNGFNVLGSDTDHDLLIQPINDAVLTIKDMTEDELMKRFSEKTRYNIRLSKRKGVEVYYSRNKEDLKTFYELYKITTIRDKIGCRSYEYFERMLEAYDEEHLRIYIAKHEEDKLSAAIAITYGTEMFYLYGASSNEKRNLMPNYAMQWEMIKWGLERKCHTYNLGGVLILDPNNGLYKFKNGFCKQEGITTYIGEIDKVYNKLIYILYTKCLPVLKKIKRKFRKNK